MFETLQKHGPFLYARAGVRSAAGWSVPAAVFPGEQTNERRAAGHALPSSLQFVCLVLFPIAAWASSTTSSGADSPVSKAPARHQVGVPPRAPARISGQESGLRALPPGPPLLFGGPEARPSRRAEADALAARAARGLPGRSLIGQAGGPAGKGWEIRRKSPVHAWPTPAVGELIATPSGYRRVRPPRRR